MDQIVNEQRSMKEEQRAFNSRLNLSTALISDLVESDFRQKLRALFGRGFDKRANICSIDDAVLYLNENNILKTTVSRAVRHISEDLLVSTYQKSFLINFKCDFLMLLVFIN